MLMGAVCPKEVYPPADPLQFCTTAYAGGYDSRATLAFIKETAKEPVRIGFAAMAIPLSRGEIDYAEEQAKTMGMTPVDKEVIPPPTADYTPFATKLKDANPNWVFSWAPWVTQVKTFEALRRLGWQGDYITWAHIEAEARAGAAQGRQVLRDRRQLAVPGQPADPQGDHRGGEEGQPALSGRAAHRRLDRRPGARGRTQGAGWPADAAKIRTAMEDVKVDTKGLRGGPIEWSKDNHFRTRQYYRVYRWDPAKSAVASGQGLGGLRREVTGTPCRSSRARAKRGNRIHGAANPCAPSPRGRLGWGTGQHVHSGLVDASPAPRNPGRPTSHGLSANRR